MSAALQPKDYKRRSVTRETYARGRYKGSRPIVVSIDCVEAVLTLRLKGTRREYPVTIEQCFSLASKLYAQKQRAERAAKRAAKRAGLK